MTQMESRRGECVSRAEAGDTKAQFQLGVLFLLGESQPQDLEAAYRWLARASAGGLETAQSLVAKLEPFRPVPPQEGWLARRWRPLQEAAGVLLVLAKRLPELRSRISNLPILNRWMRETLAQARRFVHTVRDSVSAWLRTVKAQATRVAPAASVLLWSAIVVCTLFFSVVALRTPAAALAGLLTGTTVQLLCQMLAMRRLSHSPHLSALVTFSFDREGLHSSFHEPRIRQYISSWRWRTMSAMAAGASCFGVLELAIPQWSLLPPRLATTPVSGALIEAGEKLLPLAVGTVFLLVHGADRFWREQVKEAIRKRAAKALRELQRPGEVDGLEAGVRALAAHFRKERSSPDHFSHPLYRNAIDQCLAADANTAIVRLNDTVALLDAVTELARLDLANLSTALQIQRRVEQRMESVEILATETHEPALELEIEDLRRELGLLGDLAQDRRWDEHRMNAEQLLVRAGEAHRKLVKLTRMTPRSVLSPGVDPYRLLGVGSNTPTAIIKKLRQRLALVYHPDAGGETSNANKMAELNSAYDAIMRDREIAERYQ